MLHIERVRGTDEGVLVLDSNSLSRSEISINLFRANWEAVRAILTFARVTFFRGDEHLVFSSCMAGSSDMPGTIAGRKDNLLLSLNLSSRQALSAVLFQHYVLLSAGIHALKLLPPLCSTL